MPHRDGALPTLTAATTAARAAPQQDRSLCLFVGDISLAGGTERASATLADVLVEAGWRVTVLSMHGGATSYFTLPPGVPLHHVWPAMVRMRWRLPFTLWRIRRFMARHRFDAWVDAETALTAYSTLALRGYPVRHFAWENFNLGISLGSLLRRIGRYCAVHWADGAVLLTEADRRDWIAHFGWPEKLSVIPHCVQHNAPAPRPDAQRDKAILSVGRLCHQKGYDLLLHSWARIAHRHPDWVLRILGNGEKQHELHTLAGELAIGERVQWLAATPDVSPHYAQARLYALSSRFEGFGLVLIEAMTHALPIVAFDCPYGPAEIVLDGQTGHLVPPGDTAAFAHQLDTLIRDDEQRQRMADEAHTASQRYTKGHNREQWLRLLTGREPLSQTRVNP
jgi:glycosyltransferase involved in cell wall biosynthesis